MFEVLQYAFIQKALIAGSLIALSCSLLGGFLVLKRLSMIGDGLAHVSFATVALGIFLGVAPLYISLPLVMIASVGVLKLSHKGGVNGDASIALLSSFSVALGVILISLKGGVNVDIESYLFGSILAIRWGEVVMSVVLSIIVITSVLFLYHDLFALTYDEDFAKASGMKTELYNYALVLLTAITVVLGVRVVGTMLVSSLIVIPVVAALQLRIGFKSTLLFSALFSLFSVVTGIFSAYFLDLPAGATIVMVNFCIFLILFVKSLAKR